MPTLFKSHGVYKVRYRGPDGRKHTSTTRETDRGRALEVLKASKLGDIERAAHANALTNDSLVKIIAGRKVTNHTALCQWREWRSRYASANTVSNHWCYLLRLFTEEGANQKPVTVLTEAALDRFINTKEDVKLATRKQRMSAVRSYFKFCSAQGYCVGNPAGLAGVRLNTLTHDQKEPGVREPYTAEEYNLVAAEADGFWRWAVPLGYWTGMRLTDIATLEWASFTDRNEVVVWTRKTGARIALPLSDPLVGAGVLVPLLMELTMEHMHNRQFCFPKERTVVLDPMKRAKLSVQFGRLAGSCGIEKTFHCLRHSFATRLAATGKSVVDIGRLLGHSNTATTQGYIHTP